MEDQDKEVMDLTDSEDELERKDKLSQGWAPMTDEFMKKILVL